jgi:CRISPR-associated protein Cmr6
MTLVPDAASKVPLMFRAQINGRCQLQRLIKGEEPDAQRWADEWVDKTYPDAPAIPEADPLVQSRVYALTWRFVTNSGQDDGVIRPVMGAKGWPFYPGSSMKGIFRRACTPEQADRYCGKSLPGGDFEPGSLRFLGGYPTDTAWTENLVDIIHPQQDWQVKSSSKAGGAFCQISLYKPELRFGISTRDRTINWDEVWQIWEQALSTGIGCRVCSGYGQPEHHTGTVLYRGKLKGQGQAAKLFDGTGEFRPNIFRAAIRGHALRIFGGLTDEDSADRLVNQLFGSAIDKGTVGLLSMNFRDTTLEIDSFGQGSYEQPTYAVEGDLIWFLTQPLPPDQEDTLKKLIAALTRFAMLLGGFGKSWRRADHRKFYEDYYDQGRKPLIGCHWEWVGERSQVLDIPVRKLDKVGDCIDKVRQCASDWMQVQRSQPNQPAPWREAWHPGKVQVWGRLANDVEDCEAIRWLHAAYRKAVPSARIAEGSIYQSSVTGRVERGNSQVGRIWHRMYPVVRLVKNPDDPNGKPLPKKTPQYFELLTVFPDDSPQSDDLLDFLTNDKSHKFEKLWGG